MGRTERIDVREPEEGAARHRDRPPRSAAARRVLEAGVPQRLALSRRFGLQVVPPMAGLAATARRAR